MITEIYTQEEQDWLVENADRVRAMRESRYRDHDIGWEIAARELYGDDAVDAIKQVCARRGSDNE